MSVEWRAIRNIALSVLVAGALFGAIMPVQRALTSSKGIEWQQQRMSFLPRSTVLKPLLLGFHTTYANFLWFKTVNYFGTHYITDRSFPWLVQMVDMVTRLNPWFEPAYEFAGVVLPELTDAPGASETLLERAITYIGTTSYKPYFYRGVLKLKQGEEHRGEAAAFMARAALVPSDHSAKLARMAATFAYRAGGSAEKLWYLAFMLETTDSPALRRVLEEQFAAAKLAATGN